MFKEDEIFNVVLGHCGFYFDNHIKHKNTFSGKRRSLFFSQQMVLAF